MKIPNSQRHNSYRAAIGNALRMKNEGMDLRSAFAHSIPAGMADSDDEDESGDGETEDTEDEDDSDEGEDGDGDASGSTEQDDVKDPEKKRLSDEAAKWRKKFRDEQKRRRDAEKQGKKDDDTDGAEELETLRQQNAELLQRLRDSEVKSTFSDAAADLGVDPKKMKAARLLLKEHEEDFIEDGVVDADELRSALEEVVRENPYLKAEAKKDEDDDDDEDDSDKAKGQKQPSGRQTNGKKKQSGGLDRETLAQKFPALRR